MKTEKRRPSQAQPTQQSASPSKRRSRSRDDHSSQAAEQSPQGLDYFQGQTLRIPERDVPSDEAKELLASKSTEVAAQEVLRHSQPEERSHLQQREYYATQRGAEEEEQVIFEARDNNLQADPKRQMYIEGTPIKAQRQKNKKSSDKAMSSCGSSCGEADVGEERRRESCLEDEIVPKWPAYKEQRQTLEKLARMPPKYYKVNPIKKSLTKRKSSNTPLISSMTKKKLTLTPVMYQTPTAQNSIPSPTFKLRVHSIQNGPDNGRCNTRISVRDSQVNLLSRRSPNQDARSNDKTLPLQPSTARYALQNFFSAEVQSQLDILEQMEDFDKVDDIQQEDMDSFLQQDPLLSAPTPRQAQPQSFLIPREQQPSSFGKQAFNSIGGNFLASGAYPTDLSLRSRAFSVEVSNPARREQYISRQHGEATPNFQSACNSVSVESSQGQVPPALAPKHTSNSRFQPRSFVIPQTLQLEKFEESKEQNENQVKEVYFQDIKEEAKDEFMVRSRRSSEPHRRSGILIEESCQPDQRSLSRLSNSMPNSLPPSTQNSRPHSSAARPQSLPASKPASRPTSRRASQALRIENDSSWLYSVGDGSELDPRSPFPPSSDPSDIAYYQKRIISLERRTKAQSTVLKQVRTMIINSLPGHLKKTWTGKSPQEQTKGVVDALKELIDESKRQTWQLQRKQIELGSKQQENDKLSSKIEELKQSLRSKDEEIAHRIEHMQEQDRILEAQYLELKDMKAKEKFLKEEAEKSFQLEASTQEMAIIIKEEHRAKSELEHDLIRTEMKFERLCNQISDLEDDQQERIKYCQALEKANERYELQVEDLKSEAKIKSQEYQSALKEIEELRECMKLF